MKQTIVTFLLLFTGMAQAQTTVPEMPQKDFSALPTGLVKDVIDGDTVILEIEGKTEKVRLFGIDTPETKYPDKPSEHYGQMASLFSRNLLMGEEVWVEEEAKGPKRDRYNRRVLYLYRAPDGLFANLEIIRQGYGATYRGGPFQYADLFKHYENRARTLEKGMWGKTPAKATVSNAGMKKHKTLGTGSVYRTKTGEKYHREGCSSLSKSKSALSVSQAKSKGLGPCSRCNPPL